MYTKDTFYGSVYAMYVFRYLPESDGESHIGMEDHEISKTRKIGSRITRLQTISKYNDRQHITRIVMEPGNSNGRINTECGKVDCSDATSP